MSTDVVDQDECPSPSVEELTVTAEPGGTLTAERGGELHTEAVGKLTVAGKVWAADKLLSPTEKKELAKCERKIARGRKAFIDVGNALATIRDKRLYRQTHDTFRAYCQERWGFSDSRARQLIKGVKVQETVTRVTLPDEKTARVLNRVPEEQREACYQSYIGLAKDRGDEPSAAGLKDHVDSWLADDEPCSEPTEEANERVAQEGESADERERRREEWERKLARANRWSLTGKTARKTWMDELERTAVGWRGLQMHVPINGSIKRQKPDDKAAFLLSCKEVRRLVVCNLDRLEAAIGQAGEPNQAEEEEENEE